MQGDQFAAELGQGAEQVEAGSQRQAREVDFQEFGVAGAVGGAVENRIDIVQDSSRIGCFTHTELGLYRTHEFIREVYRLTASGK